GQAVTLGAVVTTPVVLHPEPEMPLPVILKSRGKGPNPQPVCVLLHLDGKAAALQHPLVPDLLDKSWLVASPDLRATGETKPPRGTAHGGAPDHHCAHH